jgi:hypothetical protein
MRFVTCLQIMAMCVFICLLAISYVGCDSRHAAAVPSKDPFKPPSYGCVLLPSDKYLINSNGERMYLERTPDSDCIQVTLQDIQDVLVDPLPYGYLFDQIFYVTIESYPSGAEVYLTDEYQKLNQRVGITPFDLPIEFCKWDGVFWFKEPIFSVGQIWNIGATETRIRDTSGKWFRSLVRCNEAEHHVLHLLIRGKDYYDIYVSFPLDIRLDRDDRRLLVIDGYEGYLLDGTSIIPYDFPVKLVQHGRVFSSKMSEEIERGDYYSAEEMRLTRISELENSLEENRKFAKDGITTTSQIHEQLMKSELDRLKHMVGLLDPHLMGIRKQLLAKLKEGDVDAALALAKSVEAMEKKYFPPEPPKTIVVQAPRREYVEPSRETQSDKAGGKQEIMVQQKPYYGVTNIVQALGAIRGSKLDPEDYQRALGHAQLLDILGFGSELLNK